MRVWHSDEIAGPFSDDGHVLRQENDLSNKNFGGILASMDLGPGEEIWVRWYEYLPADFCLANGVNGDADGGAGSIKWMRFQYPGAGGGARITLLLEASNGCRPPCNRCYEAVQPDVIGGEGFGWRERYGNQAVWPDDPQTPLGEWHALQVYMRLSTGSASQGDGDGLIRVWIDEEPVAEFDRNTLPVDGGHLLSVHWGNYWNGGFPRDQHMYLDEVIMTSETPDTTDSAGNPFIHPDTRVGHFSGRVFPDAGPGTDAGAPGDGGVLRPDGGPMVDDAGSGDAGRIDAGRNDGGAQPDTSSGVDASGPTTDLGGCATAIAANGLPMSVVFSALLFWGWRRRPQNRTGC